MSAYISTGRLDEGILSNTLNWEISSIGSLHEPFS